MNIVIPHQVIYETDGQVPIDRVIESLQAQRQLILEAIPVIETLVPQLSIDKISISVSAVLNQSPLTEKLAIAIFVVFQEDLTKEVPQLIQEITGVTVSPSYNTIVTLVVVLILLYGADAAFRVLARRLGTSRSSRQLDGVVGDLSKQLGVPEEKIRKTLQERYAAKSKLQSLMEAAVKFVSPSKSEGDAPIKIGDHHLDRADVAEIPAVAQPAEDEADRSDPIENVEIELHAQDLDQAKRGWAGIPKGHSQSRLRMDIYPPITPEELWGKGVIRGDIILVSRVRDGKATPYMFHLVRLRD